MSEPPRFVLVKNAVVYRLRVIMYGRRRGDYKFEVTYWPEKLPEHQVIDEGRAQRIMQASLAEFEARLLKRRRCLV
jgi:hypothetical protein